VPDDDVVDGDVDVDVDVNDVDAEDDVDADVAGAVELDPARKVVENL